MGKIVSILRQSKLLNVIFICQIFLSFHYYLIIYINSSFLDQFFTETQISSLYIIGSVLSIFVLLNISKLLKKIGNYKTTLYGIALEMISILGLTLSSNPFLIALYFTITQIVNLTILFNLDIFLESLSTKEEDTGSIRSIYLTVSNITLVIAPTIASFLIIQDTYWRVYATSFLFIIPLYIFIKRYFKDYKDTTEKHIKIRETIKEYLREKKLYNIFIIYFLLQFFYAFMVVYTPIYLRNIGFAWSEIGIMFTIMLLPFVIFQIPVGNLADNKYGEKEFMTIGLIIIGLATMSMGFITTQSFIIWTSLLFMSRVGASILEITADSYFFKQVNQEKTNLIGFYRIARPLSFVVAPIVTTIASQFIPLQYTFLVMGAFMIIGVKYSLSIIDSR
ncbi:MAG: MFS transporter [Candidatus Paceibacterota bacterium]